MTRTSITSHRTIKAPRAQGVADEVGRSLGLRPGERLLAVQFERFPSGRLAAATVTTAQEVEAITARESDAAWAQAQREAS